MRSHFLILASVLTLAACVGPQSPYDASVEIPGETSSAIAVNPRLRAQTIVNQFVSVVQNVEPVAEQVCRQRNPELNCDFQILVDDRPGAPPNAFQTEDSRGRPVIAFTIALLAEVWNSDELAFVMAHESAHHIRGHLARQRQNAYVGAAILGTLAGVTGSEDEIRSAQEIGAALGARTYSKDYELEADALGTLITARAGYDPVHGAQFFARIPDPGNRFLGTHPANGERIAVVRRTAAAISAY